MPEFSSKYHTVWDIINSSVIRGLSRKQVGQLRTNSDEYIFVTTGRLHVLKGYDMAVEAAHFETKGVKFNGILLEKVLKGMILKNK